MSYLALAQKYRPTKLSDIVGQNVATKIMSNAILTDRVHHALLFSGTRGVGKTTFARILASTLNCSAPIINEMPEPCMQCSNCKNILSYTHPDVLEFDAASKTGVDSIRDIIDSTMYVPSMGKYKIYIIDEVHMLSKAAFNALLKTIEEPPAQTKFILATTEVKKIPITILSRCQKFLLRPIGKDAIYDTIKHIAKLENININDDAILSIARAAQGSLRDALSLFEQSILLSDCHISNNAISTSTISDLIYHSDATAICGIIEAIIENNSTESTVLIDQLLSSGHDATMILNEMLHIIIVMMQKISDTQITHEDMAVIDNILQKHRNVISMPFLGRIWTIATNTMRDMKYLDHSMLLSMMCMKMIYTAKLPTTIDVLNSIDQALVSSIKQHVE